MSRRYERYYELNFFLQNFLSVYWRHIILPVAVHFGVFFLVMPLLRLDHRIIILIFLKVTIIHLFHEFHPVRVWEPDWQRLTIQYHFLRVQGPPHFLLGAVGNEGEASQSSIMDLPLPVDNGAKAFQPGFHLSLVGVVLQSSYEDLCWKRPWKLDLDLLALKDVGGERQGRHSPCVVLEYHEPEVGTIFDPELLHPAELSEVLQGVLPIHLFGKISNKYSSLVIHPPAADVDV